MFKRGGAVTRSLHAPHGVNIIALDKNPRMKRKLSWSSPKVRGAASEGVLTHKPVLLKEGFLYKPGFFRIGGRKRRWCVLRTYSQREASIDIYTDDTTSRFKGTISLDKDLCPMLIVKNYDFKKKKSPKNVYLVLKIGKRNYQFTTDSIRELKEWSALLRQAIDNGFLFSGKITEPLNIEDGMVNVKLNSNCIAVICPIKETAIKTWRLNHITSFGQCGGILTFESCPTCSDPGTSRCSINIIQEKPSTILNLLEKAIRSNPNTGEIHYERSILGDIYHCDHECGQGRRILPAYSEPNIFRSASSSPQKEMVVPIDIHEMDIPYSTLSSGKSNDSGFPGTPLPQQDALSIHSNTPSPTDVTTTHIPKHGAKINILTPKHVKSVSEIVEGNVPPFLQRRMSAESEYSSSHRLSRTYYTDVKTAANPSSRWSKIEDNTVQYSEVKLPPQEDTRERVRTYSKLQPLNENEGIYDIPFEPPGCSDNEVSSNPPNERMKSQRDSYINVPSFGKTAAQSTSNTHIESDGQGRDDDIGVPPVPSRHRRRPPVKETVTLLNNMSNQKKGRSRLTSAGDILDCAPNFQRGPRSNCSRGSVDNLTQNEREKTPESLLVKLHQQEELLSKFMAQSRNERNDTLGYSREDELNRPYKCFIHEENDSDLDPDSHLYASPTNIRSGRSSSASDRGAADRVLTKVASDTVRGYAYKIQIPLCNREYDVPRRAAPAPDLVNLRCDAPPKPLRYVTSTDP